MLIICLNQANHLVRGLQFSNLHSHLSARNIEYAEDI